MRNEHNTEKESWEKWETGDDFSVKVDIGKRADKVIRNSSVRGLDAEKKNRSVGESNTNGLQKRIAIHR